MYIYGFTLKYAGSDIFLNALMQKTTKGTGEMRVTASLTQPQFNAIRAAGQALFFTFTQITRSPVPAEPEIVP